VPLGVTRADEPALVRAPSDDLGAATCAALPGTNSTACKLSVDDAEGELGTDAAGDADCCDDARGGAGEVITGAGAGSATDPLATLADAVDPADEAPPWLSKAGIAAGLFVAIELLPIVAAFLSPKRSERAASFWSWFIVSEAFGAGALSGGALGDTALLLTEGGGLVAAPAAVVGALLPEPLVGSTGLPTFPSTLEVCGGGGFGGREDCAGVSASSPSRQMISFGAFLFIAELISLALRSLDLSSSSFAFAGDEDTCCWVSVSAPASFC